MQRLLPIRHNYSSFMLTSVILLLHFISVSTAVSKSTASSELDMLLRSEDLFSGIRLRSGKTLHKLNNGNLNLLEILEEHLENPTTLRRLHNKYRKKYEKSNEEYDEPEKKTIFKRRLLEIANHNLLAQRGLHSYEKGVNQFTDVDLNPENLTLSTKHDQRSRSARTFLHRFAKQQPSPWFPHLYGKRDSEQVAFDWRNYGAISFPKNQGRCGSCSFFATVGALESHNYLVNMASGWGGGGRSTSYTWGSPPNLSEQELLDCAGNYSGYRGCNDNLPTTALEYMKQNGLYSENDYPYQDKVGNICYTLWNRGKVKLDGYFPVFPAYDEERIKQVVLDFGPVIAGMHMSLDLKMYKFGIYDEPCKDPNGISHNIFRNHMVLIVGYGSEWVKNKNVEYWIVKNSYGHNWGDGGYFKIARNRRLCLLGEEAYYLFSRSPHGFK